jgi:F-type H+-transporting ATPase subunit gamma
MAGSKEIRNKIKSVQSTRKITKAMEMVAASKMKKAQDRMRATRPYVEKAFNIAMHIAKANTEYRHPFLVKREPVKRIGAIVVTTDKGCAAASTPTCCGWCSSAQGLEGEGHRRRLRRDRRQGAGLPAAHGRQRRRERGAARRPAASRSHGRPGEDADRRIPAGKVDEVHVFFTTFINTMSQEPRHGRIMPIPHQFSAGDGRSAHGGRRRRHWDYIYEPDARELLDGMMRRYLEASVFQMVNENMASEQSARMVAMKAASDNAGKIIQELQLIYNKTRQAAITKELSEIVGGAAAV